MSLLPRSRLLGAFTSSHQEMIRGFVRTSDACRTAIDITCGRFSASESATLHQRYAPHVGPRPSTSKAPLEKPVTEVDKPVQPEPQAISSSPSYTVAQPEASRKSNNVSTRPEISERLLPAEASVSGVASINDTPISPPSPAEENVIQKVHMRSSSVPSSRFGRLFQYGGLAFSVGIGTAQATLSRSSGGSAPTYLSESNVRRIVDTLSRMRGAALKLGQFLSIQDSKALPPQVREILTRVQNAADYMPWWQTEAILVEAFGSEWQSRFADFEQVPMAAASIGQVHRATLHDGRKVAVKIQFPGIAKSIESDISYLKALLTMSALLPRGLFLDNSLRILSRELKEECDYIREGDACTQFGQLLQDDKDYRVPAVVESLTTERVLTLEYMDGKPLARMRNADQKLRDHLGELIVRLCLKEVFQFRFMQTDPNWSNFLWNEKTSQLEIVDFGASRAYSEHFSNLYKEMIVSGIEGRSEDCEAVSRELGFLVDEDGPEMINAHVDSVLALGEPFKTGIYDFGNEDITSRIRAQIPTILQHRRTPPPNESYSLNRKLSGCFLLCSNLGSRVRCAKILEEIA